MREILFRGKRIDNGEWVFGNFIEDKWGDDNGNTVYAILQDRGAPDIAELWTPVRVISETVGEYTGLTDKNGKRIFEGDILSGGGDAYKVIFDEGVFQIENSHYITGVYVAIHMDKIDEVIGTIYDNPELLEEERK